ncbi:hypothetical protein RI129_007792 [Pyrocoelia pectoralis]|uniref:Uncharacterized protein n=1 Tax=Pyrocoelia pectoralis TaxID=417401 RepID=A0AAN7VAB2_9COLE
MKVTFLMLEFLIGTIIPIGALKTHTKFSSGDSKVDSVLTLLIFYVKALSEFHSMLCTYNKVLFNPNYFTFINFYVVMHSQKPALRNLKRATKGYFSNLSNFKHNGFVVTKGDNYGESHNEENGQDGHKGYNTEEKYEKGSQGKHDNENNKGYYNKDGGDKNSHHESSEHFSVDNEAAKGSNGGSYSESGGHKKGSKTTGYHKVYKKNDGALEKGGHSDVKFHETNQGENGDYDKGHYDVYDSKFRDHQGKEGHRENYSGYAKDSKENHGDVYGVKDY